LAGDGSGTRGRGKVGRGLGVVDVRMVAMKLSGWVRRVLHRECVVSWSVGGCVSSAYL